MGDNMLKKIYSIIKKIIISAFLLYGYNLIASPLNIMVPINLVTVAGLTILGFPALFAFIFIHILLF